MWHWFLQQKKDKKKRKNEEGDSPEAVAPAKKAKKSPVARLKNGFSENPETSAALDADREKVAAEGDFSKFRISPATVLKLKGMYISTPGIRTDSVTAQIWTIQFSRHST